MTCESTLLVVLFVQPPKATAPSAVALAYLPKAAEPSHAAIVSAPIAFPCPLTSVSVLDFAFVPIARAFVL